MLYKFIYVFCFEMMTDLANVNKLTTYVLLTLLTCEETGPFTFCEMHKALVLGAGFVSAPLFDYLTRFDDTVLTIASSLQDEVKGLLGKYKNANPVLLDVLKDQSRLDELVINSDIVISLLPYSMHSNIADVCIKHQRNLVTASYASSLDGYQDGAIKAGITILMEVGLDPGIDHMLAMECIDDIKTNNGKILSFASWCGGLPAPENSDNPLRYKFSWSPIAVLLNSTYSSSYLWNGEMVERSEGENYRNGAQYVDFMSEFDFESIPNRDAMLYKDKYDIHDVQTLFRGTLRYKGFVDAVVGLQDLGLVDVEASSILEERHDVTWKRFIARLLNIDEDVTVEKLRDHVLSRIGKKKSKLHAIEGLGLLSDELVDPQCRSPIKALEQQLLKKLSYDAGERDMTAMRLEVCAVFLNDKKEKHCVDMVVYGVPNSYKAMAKTVGFPCGIAARRLLLGKIQQKGIVIPTLKEIYQPILEELRQLGISFKKTVLQI